MLDAAAMLYEFELLKQLKAKYLRALDQKDWAGYRACFTDDVKHYTDDRLVFGSPEEWVSKLSVTFQDVVSVHQVHSPELELTGERTAKGIWPMFDWVDFKKNPERSLQGYGWYYEDYEKGSDGKWRIKICQLRRIRVDLMHKK